VTGQAVPRQGSPRPERLIVRMRKASKKLHVAIR
jgi:hypothetical protein